MASAATVTGTSPATTTATSTAAAVASGGGSGGDGGLDAVRRDCLIPDVFTEDGTLPLAANLRVTYGSGVHSFAVLPGSRVAPRDTKKAPDVQFPEVGNGEPGYTLLMIDPDTPIGTLAHWCIVNGGTSSQTVEKKYIGLGPPANTGYHRYVFILWRQTRHIERGKALKAPVSDLKAFATANGLEARPVNCNFMNGKYDCSAGPCRSTTFLCTWLCFCCVPSDDYSKRKRRK